MEDGCIESAIDQQSVCGSQSIFRGPLLWNGDTRLAKFEGDRNCMNAPAYSPVPGSGIRVLNLA
jgi:hypothetical protein